MANYNSVAAAGKSIERMLTEGFAGTARTGGRPGLPAPSWSAPKTSQPDLHDRPLSCGRRCSIFLYRVDFNKTMRAAWSQRDAHDGRPHLPLDLHFLLDARGATTPKRRALSSGRALQCLDADADPERPASSSGR